MLGIDRFRHVTMLRPEGISLSEQIGLEFNENRDCSEIAAFNAIDEKIDHVRQMIEELADECKLNVRVAEYDLPVKTKVPSRKATRWIKESNMIVTFDPSDEQLAYVMSCMRGNPVMSALLSYDSPEYIDDKLEIVEAPVSVTFDPKPHRQSRIFPVKPNLIKKNPKEIEMTKKALMFPYAA